MLTLPPPIYDLVKANNFKDAVAAARVWNAASENAQAGFTNVNNSSREKIVVASCMLRATSTAAAGVVAVSRFGNPYY